MSHSHASIETIGYLQEKLQDSKFYGRPFNVKRPIPEISNFQVYLFWSHEIQDGVRSRAFGQEGIGTDGLGGALASGAHPFRGRSKPSQRGKVFQPFSGLLS